MPVCVKITERTGVFGYNTLIIYRPIPPTGGEHFGNKSVNMLYIDSLLQDGRWGFVPRRLLMLGLTVKMLIYNRIHFAT